MAARANREQIPTLDEERRLWRAGYCCVAGVDEAGRGALAGPVTAAAVVVPMHAAHEGVWAQVRDSKLLHAPAREALFARICQEALAWAVGFVDADGVDQVGIATATRQAMGQAIATLPAPPDYLLIDWVRLPQVNVPQTCVAKADAKFVSVAAASVLAKVTRDRWMAEYETLYPGYGFGRHKGYGTAAHLAALDCLGPCPLHRRSFAPVAARPTLFGMEDGAHA